MGQMWYNTIRNSIIGGIENGKVFYEREFVSNNELKVI